MNKEDFSLALNAFLPGCTPEAANKWAEFAEECVLHEQFVYFIPMEFNAAVEKWLDATFAGLYGVNQEYGPEITARVADLACQRCALYPGEMLAAAEAVKTGCDAEKIIAMMNSGDLIMNQPYFLDLPDEAALTKQGPEIGVAQTGIPCGLMQKHVEPGYLLADGAVLLESERDAFGRYRGGTGIDGTYLPTGKLYAPVRDADGEINAFQEVKAVTSRDRERAYLTDKGDTFAIYRPKDMAQADMEGYKPLDQLRLAGASPIDGNYNLIHVLQLEPGDDDPMPTLNACRVVNTLRPGDIAVFKLDGTLTCWYVEQLAFTKLRGMLENCLKAAEMNTEQNVNQIDGIINNEAPKPSLRDTLRQYQGEVKKQSPQHPDKRPEQER